MQAVTRNLFGFIRASRVPNLIIIALTQCFTAYFLLGMAINVMVSLEFVALILSTQMIAAAGYIINDYYDQKIDMVNRPQRVVVGVTFKRRLALISHSLLNFGAIGLMLFIDPLISLIQFWFCLFALDLFEPTQKVAIGR